MRPLLFSAALPTPPDGQLPKPALTKHAGRVSVYSATITASRRGWAGLSVFCFLVQLALSFVCTHRSISQARNLSDPAGNLVSSIPNQIVSPPHRQLAKPSAHQPAHQTTTTRPSARQPHHPIKSPTNNPQPPSDRTMASPLNRLG